MPNPAPSRPASCIGKLHGEIRRAQRYGRQLTVLNIGVHAVDDPGDAARGGHAARRFVQLIDQTVRAHVDWIGRVATTQGAAFAVVLPEAGVTDAVAIKERMLMSLRRWADSNPRQRLAFTFGVVSLERGNDEGTPIEAKDMLGVAEQCRVCPGRAGPEQLSAVQRSVASHTALVCRHGYFVASECSLKGLPNATAPSAHAWRRLALILARTRDWRPDTPAAELPA